MTKFLFLYPQLGTATLSPPKLHAIGAASTLSVQVWENDERVKDEPRRLKTKHDSGRGNHGWRMTKFFPTGKRYTRSAKTPRYLSGEHTIGPGTREEKTNQLLF